MTKEEILAKHEGCTVEQINDSERILIGQDIILPAMEEYAAQFQPEKQQGNDAVERKFTLDEILLYGARCAVLGRDMNPQKYFKEKFNIDL